MQPKTSYLTYTFINNNIFGQILINNEGVKIGYCEDLSANDYNIKMARFLFYIFLYTVKTNKYSR